MSKEYHRCKSYDYCILSDSEFLLFCKDCKKASGIVEFKVVEKLKKQQFDPKTLEDMK